MISTFLIAVNFLSLSIFTAAGRKAAIRVKAHQQAPISHKCFALIKKYLAIHKVDADNLSGYITDTGQSTVYFNFLAERGLDSRCVILGKVVPIYHICEERNYPSLKIIVSDNDMQNRYEQTLLLVSTLKHFGHEKRSFIHIIGSSIVCYEPLI